MRLLLLVGLPLYLFITGIFGAIAGIVGIIGALAAFVFLGLVKMNDARVEREYASMKPNSTEPTNLNAKDQELLNDLVNTFAMSGASRELAIQQYYNIKRYNAGRGC